MSANKRGQLIHRAITRCLPAIISLGWQLHDQTRLRLSRAVTSALADDRSQDGVTAEGDACCFHEALILRAMAGPFAGNLNIVVVGHDLVKDELKNGTGAVLWIVPTSYAPTIPLAALADKGIRGNLLPGEDKNNFEKPWHTAKTEALRNEIEDRYLAGRFAGSSALRKAAEILRANGIILMSRESRDKPLGADAIELSQANSAALLPVVTIRRDDGTFLVHIGRAISKSRANTAKGIFRRLADFLEPYTVTYPAQFSKSGMLEALQKKASSTVRSLAPR